LRLLHTADWHIGRVTRNGVSRDPDIREAVERILDIAREERPDLILHCGDVFDGLRPGYSELHWGIDKLRELAEIAPTLVVAGNHDSGLLLELIGKLLGPSSTLRFVSRPLPPAEGGIIDYQTAGDQRLRVAPLPFIHANRMIDHLDDPASWMANYADRVDRIQQALARGLLDGYDPTRDVLVLAAHLFVTGARWSQSERPLHVTDAYATHVERLPAVSYAAYGHIHRPQALPGAVSGRYAGSIVQLDFGEVGEEKEVVLVDLEPGRPPQVRPRRLEAGRPLKRIEGSLEEIGRLAPEVGRAICQVIVRTEQPTPGLSEAVAQLLPEAVVDVREDYAGSRLRVLSETDLDVENEPGFGELFREYLERRRLRAGSADRVLSIYDRLLASVEQEEPALFPEVAELEAGLPPGGRG
jgi:exonuclease SbcD